MASIRRLAAILAVDVAGYSRLMEADEEGTHERLKRDFRELVHPKVTDHRGRIVKNTGDGLLAEFPSVVDAIRCAVELQWIMHDRNLGTPEDKRITFRVGVNIGAVIAEDGDIYGEGVNVAARLEALSEPGGICISRTVRDQIRDKLPYPFEDKGELNVKNIMRPLRVYALGPEAIADLSAASLPLAGAKARQPEVREIKDLREFFQAVSQATARPGNGGGGHPPHSLIKTDEGAQAYMARHGDPLEIGVAISALPILAEGVLEKLSKVLGFDTKEQAAKFWLEVYSATLPFIHQSLSRRIAKPLSASSVKRVSWSFSDDTDLVDVTPNPAADEADPKEHD
jgi:class 3 adenylate cyclase